MHEHQKKRFKYIDMKKIDNIYLYFWLKKPENLIFNIKIEKHASNHQRFIY